MRHGWTRRNCPPSYKHLNLSGTAHDFTHRPVMLDEALEALHIDSDGIYVDGTFGRGGHTEAMLRKLGPQGHVLSIDKDPDAVHTAQQRFGATPVLTLSAVRLRACSNLWCNVPGQDRCVAYYWI